MFRLTRIDVHAVHLPGHYNDNSMAFNISAWVFDDIDVDWLT